MAINLFGRDAIFGLGDEAIDDDAEQLDIPIHAFDLVIADECHRGYTAQELSVWRKTLDHFDAIKIGLTATPAAHTTSLLQGHRLSLRIRAGRPRGLPRRLRRRERQLRRAHERHLPQGGRAGRRRRPRDRRRAARPAGGRAAVRHRRDRAAASPSPDSNRKIIEEIKKYALEHEQRVRPLPQDPDLRRQRPAAHLPRRPARGHLPRRVRPGRRVRRRRSPAAWTARSSASASSATARSPASSSPWTCSRPASTSPTWSSSSSCARCKSRILFEQMLGRGTRKGERFPDKSHFIVFDCFDGTLAGVLPQGHRPSPPSRPSAPPARSSRSSRTSGPTATASTTSAAWSSASSASTRRCPARPGSCSPPTSPTATSAASPRSFPGACARISSATMRLLRDKRLPGPAR